MACLRPKKTLCSGPLSPYTKIVHEQINVIYVMYVHFAVDWCAFCFHKSKIIVLLRERLDRPNCALTTDQWPSAVSARFAPVPARVITCLSEQSAALRGQPHVHWTSSSTLTAPHCIRWCAASKWNSWEWNKWKRNETAHRGTCAAWETRVQSAGELQLI